MASETRKISVAYELSEALYGLKLPWDRLRAHYNPSDLTMPAMIELLIHLVTLDPLTERQIEAIKKFDPKSKRGRPRKFWTDNVQHYGNSDDDSR